MQGLKSPFINGWHCDSVLLLILSMLKVKSVDESVQFGTQHGMRNFAGAEGIPQMDIIRIFPVLLPFLRNCLRITVINIQQ